jgi:hypothetical protein
MATLHAQEVIRKSTAPDNSLRSPIWRLRGPHDLAVISAPEGDLDAAIDAGNAALDIPRQSVPSLLMVTDDLVTELRSRYEAEAGTIEYLDRIRTLGN